MIRYLMHYAAEKDQYKWLNEIIALSLKNNYQPGLAYKNYYEGCLLKDKLMYDAAIGKFKNCINVLDSLGIVQPSEYPLSAIGLLYDRTGRQMEKFLYYSDKLFFYNAKGPVENTANCLNGEAEFYLFLADYEKAIDHYKAARKVYNSFDSIGAVNQIGLIGNAFLQWGNILKAEEYLKSGLKESLRTNNNRSTLFCYNNLANLYFIKQDFDKAMQYCFDMTIQFPDLSPEYKAINMVNRAAIHLRLNNADSALYYLNAANAIRQQEPLALVQQYGNFEIDFYYYLYFARLGNFRKAVKSLETALHKAKVSAYFPFILKYTDELHQYLLKNGDSLHSFNYLKQYKSIKDSLDTVIKLSRITSYEIEQYEQLQDNEIQQRQTKKANQRIYFLIGAAFFLMISLGMLSRYLYIRRTDKEKLTADFKKQLAQAEIKALRAQMNPHFIFNCLTSINCFILDHNHEVASEYLIKFSKLMRLILENSMNDTVTIEKELEALKLYIELESVRYDNKFTFECHVDKCINTNITMIPPMLLQPFIENSIWHGLMHKGSPGTITLDIKKLNSDFLKILISDDGIGREKAAEKSDKSGNHKSHGLQVTSHRIEMLNKLYAAGASLHIIDLKDDSGLAIGTRVELIIPF
jgi:tetratricopeptide (TPR) repeat protein